MFCKTENNVQLSYQVYGAEHCATLLMIQGLSMQLIDWPQSLIAALAKNFKVVVFDNRDVGLSSKFENTESLTQIAKCPNFFQQPENIASYTLFDMAEDALQLMNALSIKTFHLLGYSMGGMIAQIIAAQHPHRVLSLISLSSSDGRSEIESTDDARIAMAQSAMIYPIKQAMLHMLDAATIYAGTTYLIDKEQYQKAILYGVERSYNPHGVYRQGLAMRFTGDRQALLKSITAPSLVIHGTEDPCISLQQGLAAAKLIESCETFLFEGLGHDFPEQIQAKLAARVLQHIM